MAKKAQSKTGEPEVQSHGPEVIVSRDLPDAEIEITEGSSITHEDKPYGGGDRLTVDGGLALSLEAQGVAKIVGDGE